MAEPYLSEIRLMSFGYAPRGWAQCNGQLMPVAQNQALFALLGTTYGGDGRMTFGLPNLQGRTPVHFGPDAMGAVMGEENHTLLLTEIPVHVHTLSGTTTAATTPVPTGNVLATATNLYGNPPGTTLRPSTLMPAGGGQAHNNMQPYLVLNFCICLQGVFPSQS